MLQNKKAFVYLQRLKRTIVLNKNAAGMVKLVDTPDLGSGAARCEGSSPFTRTNKTSNHKIWGLKVVREAGLEPARPEWTLEPESSESANSTTRACIECSDIIALRQAACQEKNTAGKKYSGCIWKRPYYLSLAGSSSSSLEASMSSTRRNCVS